MTRLLFRCIIIFFITTQSIKQAEVQVKSRNRMKYQLTLFEIIFSIIRTTYIMYISTTITEVIFYGQRSKFQNDGYGNGH
jgi:hypothetical protein